MNNILNYYYQIIINDDKIDNNGLFVYNNHLFSLYKLKRNINEVNALFYLNELMLAHNININKIVKNTFDQIITVYNEYSYVLIEVNYEYLDKANIKFINSFYDKKLDILKRNNWGELWSIKIDYIEYQLMHINNSYPIINESINYYIGLAENAISYFNMLDLKDVSLYIEHRRFNRKTIFNPMELVIDYKVRDIAEYIKECFFCKKMTIIEIQNYLYKLDLDNIDYVLLYVRLLFPSYYFDLYEEIINNNKNEKELNSIIELSKEYEKLLYNIFLIIEKRINIIVINWINYNFV